jgi:hypothetical protein
MQLTGGGHLLVRIPKASACWPATDLHVFGCCVGGRIPIGVVDGGHGPVRGADLQSDQAGTT